MLKHSLALIALLASCQASRDTYTVPIYDAGMFAPPPGRIVSGDAGTGDGSGDGWSPIGIGGTGTGLPTCTKNDQASCCYDGVKFSGTPKCAWRRMGVGQSITITTAFRGRTTEKVTLPAPLTLTNVSPERYESQNSCDKSDLGWTLSGAGLKEAQLGTTISEFTIDSFGAWRGEGGGATFGLVAGMDSDLSRQRDGAVGGPSFTMHPSLCGERTVGRKLVVLFTEIWFTMNGVDYEARFHQSSESGNTAYYTVIDRAY